MSRKDRSLPTRAAGALTALVTLAFPLPFIALTVYDVSTNGAGSVLLHFGVGIFALFVFAKMCAKAIAIVDFIALAMHQRKRIAMTRVSAKRSPPRQARELVAAP